MLGRRGAIALTCAAALLVPAAAHANAFDDALKEYRKTGAVDGCKHTAAELAQAKAQMPEDVAQIAPGFPAQLAAAGAQRAKGCGTDAAQGTSTATAATPPASTTTTAPAATQPPAAAQPAPAPATTAAAQPAAAQPAPAPATTAAPQQAAAADDGVPVVLVVAGALVLLIPILFGLARWWAWEPYWLVRWRHATAEAGWRASAAWAEFTDWLRLGR
jgi:cell division septation protein DedD